MAGVIGLFAVFVFRATRICAEAPDLAATLASANIRFLWHPTLSEETGAEARPLARVIQREVKDPLTEEVLFGRLTKGGHVRVVVKGPAGEADASFGFDYDDEEEPALV